MSLRRAMVSLVGAGLALGLTAAPGTPAGADPSHHQKVADYPIPGDDIFPEGVAADPRSSRFYVGSTTDGAVYRGDLRGGALDLFLPGGADGRTTVTGMKVDQRGRLYVAGAGTGQMFVYDTATGALIRSFDTGHRGDTFLNDVAFDRAGNAYFTDSLLPVLWRVPASAVRSGLGVGTPEAFLSFDGTPAAYEPGFNLNGIVATEGGNSLVAVASNTGKLFRIDVGSRGVAEVPVTGGPLTAGDGILLAGGRLLVVRNQLSTIVSVALGHSSARVVAQYTDPAFRFPTTVATSHGQVLVVNSQFDRRNAGLPADPFSITGVPLESVLRGQ